MNLCNGAGTTTLFAALNILEGITIGCCMQHHRHQEFIRFLNAVKAQVPGWEDRSPHSRQLRHPQTPEGDGVVGLASPLRLPLHFSEFDFFRPASPAALRAVGASAGDWSVLAAREVSRILAEERRRPEALARGIDELRSREVISDEEVEDLKQIVAAFFSAIRGQSTTEASQATILDRYGRLSRNGSPAAVAIASVAARNLVLPAAPGMH